MQNTNKNNENVQTHVDMYSGHNIIYTDDLEKCYISYLDTYTIYIETPFLHGLLEIC